MLIKQCLYCKSYISGYSLFICSYCIDNNKVAYTYNYYDNLDFISK